MRFRDHRQREEIRAALKVEYGIALSSGEVSLLTGRFVEHLAELHHQRAPDLRAALEQDGGYPMHIDATGEDGRGTLFMTYAGSRQWVLGAWKIATERAELILPCLRQTVARFGPPMAIMRDLGKAVIPAAKTLAQETGRPIAILSCHFHFLRDVGKDLLVEGHNALRDLFRRFKTRPALRTLACNLERDDYVAILCGSLDQLPLAFARLDQDRRRTRRASPPATPTPDTPDIAPIPQNDAPTEADADLDAVVSASLPRDDRRLVRTSQLGDRIGTAARSRAPRRIPA